MSQISSAQLAREFRLYMDFDILMGPLSNISLYMDFDILTGPLSNISLCMEFDILTGPLSNISKSVYNLNSRVSAQPSFPPQGYQTSHEHICNKKERQ